MSAPPRTRRSEFRAQAKAPVFDSRPKLSLVPKPPRPWHDHPGVLWAGYVLLWCASLVYCYLHLVGRL